MTTVRSGIGAADHGKRLAEVFVPQFRGELAVRLVEDLEEHLGGPVLVPLGELRPDGQESGLQPGGVARHGLELVEIEDDQELICQRLIHGPVQGLEPVVAELASGPAVVAERMEVDPDMVEAGLADRPEMLGLEPAPIGMPPEVVISQNVDAAAESLVEGEGGVTAARP